MGGLVTSHHAGMSVPDWPNSYGYNMFLFPPSHWVGGILYEHTHRLMATVVGMLSIALVLWAWRNQLIGGLLRLANLSSAELYWHRREPHRYLALVVLAAVIFQGVLGGLRVVLVQLDLAIVHACVAQAFFCLTAYMALVTSSRWNDMHPRLPATAGLYRLGMITVATIFLQLIVGATMRHFDAGLAIPDLPLVYGKILPPMSSQDLAAINHVRAFQLNLDPVTLGQVWLHFAHRMGAVLVSVLVIALCVMALRSRRAEGLTLPAVFLLVLLCVQVTLGVLTVYLHKPADVASTHVAVGALVLVTSFILTLRAGRLVHSQADVPRTFESEPSRLPATRLAIN